MLNALLVSMAGFAHKIGAGTGILDPGTESQAGESFKAKQNFGCQRGRDKQRPGEVDRREKSRT
jgi:hypothetical protein